MSTARSLPRYAKSFRSISLAATHCQVVVDNIRQTISLYRAGQPYEMPSAFEDRLQQTLKSRWEEKFGPPGLQRETAKGSRHNIE